MLTSFIAGFIIGQDPKPPTKQLWFMFFLKGDGPRPADPKELTKMQEGHIKNLQTQGQAGHLLAAGPLTDPTQQRRGITVALASERPDVDALFTTDPFVKSKIMYVTAARWEAEFGGFRADYDKENMDEYELLVTTQNLLRRTRTSLRSFAVGGRTSYSVSEKYPFSGEVWISRKSDHEKLVAAMGDVAAPREIIPLWMAKGLLKPAG
jgi:uncharacterized protein YciI